MNYELTIPDIYSVSSKKIDNCYIAEYYFKPYEVISIINDHTINYVFFETENNKIYLNNKIIWNKKILFVNNNIFKSFYLENRSNYNAKLTIYFVKWRITQQNKCRLQNAISYNRKSKRINEILFDSCNASIILIIFIKCNNKITEKIITIKSQPSNFICFYKTKLISSNQIYYYELKLCGIKSIFTDKYIDINLNYNNIYEINDVYYRELIKFTKFMDNNHDVCVSNNIDVYVSNRDKFYTRILKNILNYYSHNDAYDAYNDNDTDTDNDTANDTDTDNDTANDTDNNIYNDADNDTDYDADNDTDYDTVYILNSKFTDYYFFNIKNLKKKYCIRYIGIYRYSI